MKRIDFILSILTAKKTNKKWEETLGGEGYVYDLEDGDGFPSMMDPRFLMNPTFIRLDPLDTYGFSHVNHISIKCFFIKLTNFPSIV